MIVLAGPGSGKTRVLARRIGFLVRHGALPSTIVAVTFTNKAANEMRNRIKKVLGIKHDSKLQVVVGTFHWVCLHILREFGHHVGLEDNFLIFNAYRQKELVIQAMGELGISTEKMQRADFCHFESEIAQSWAAKRRRVPAQRPSAMEPHVCQHCPARL